MDVFPIGETLQHALIAPLGASAVLAFAVPNAPLAQPWSAIVGNTLSALVAVALLSVYAGAWAPPLVVGLAILTMLFARALHPPGGAVALLAALDPGPVIESGLTYALIPVGAMTALLVASAVIYNRLTDRIYPFRQIAERAKTADEVRLGLSEDDLTGLLQNYRQTSNIGVVDLGRLLTAAERDAANHRFDSVTCGDIMTNNLISVTPDTDVRQVARLFRKHRIKSLPVVSVSGAFSGIIVQADVIDALVSSKLDLQLVSRNARMTAGTIARPAGPTSTVDTPVGPLLNRLSVQGAETVPVMNGERLAGVITRSDILRMLLRDARERRTGRVAQINCNSERVLSKTEFRRCARSLGCQVV
ncbi:HPP family protein [Sedimentitalea sp.]|uniref:HPP family protein n=1 Tax=Sedimentitalea sp. TaxID=2048915 RepID=UPI00329917A9